MDVTLVAAGAAALLAPFVRKAAEEFAGEAGRGVWEIAQRLLSRLKGAFRPDAAASEVLDRYEQTPDATRDQLVALLEDRLRADPELAAFVADSLARAKRAGAEVHVVQKIVEAERVVGAKVGRLRSDSSLRVEQDVQKGTEIVGVSIDEL